MRTPGDTDIRVQAQARHETMTLRFLQMDGQRRPVSCQKCSRHIGLDEWYATWGMKILCLSCADALQGKSEPELPPGKIERMPALGATALRMDLQRQNLHAALALLRELEWSKTRLGCEPAPEQQPPIFKACPLCGGVQPSDWPEDSENYFPAREIGHEEGCRLAALLKEDLDDMA